ncbi:hypothetical protein SCLCIDRAFT_1219985 [Scleroderma citrinum Foug A]|uniref:Uncharacterized protein n=1 Tax=Scleroderma citrinum Foug A TaxID=1036808 RepID=A0A0C2Z4Q5_9AGAM|nr:hypothetical protein SCLCIDRAFT_1219985 [Scleroderma citrinum Foug A]
MARGKPTKPIVVKVPRHGSQRIGANLTAAVLAVVRKDNKNLKSKSRTRYKHNSNPPSGALAQAIASASDWNSLLLTARAERGPQWDVGTQQFQVDFGSDLYYDPTPLNEAVRQQRPTEEDNVPPRPTVMQTPDFRHESPRISRNPSASTPGQPNFGYASPRHPQHPPQGTPYGGIPPGHFYGDPRAVGGMGTMSPRRPQRAGPEDAYIALHGP